LPDVAVWGMFICTMETKVIKLDPANVDAGRIEEAAGAVDAGGLVVFPTETVYGIACQVDSSPLARLDNLKGRDAQKPYTLHIAKKDDLGEYVPTLGARAAKLVDKTWPGPLTIVFELEPEDIERQKAGLKQEAFSRLYRGNTIGVRCPDNPIAQALLETANCPVIAPSANRGGQLPAVDAKEAIASLSGHVDMVLDGGACKYGKSSTVAKIGKRGLEILRGGVYAEEDVKRLSQIKFLFVCTGNTCRSPMAEGIFRKYLAEKLECEVDRIGEMGYKVASAGVLDMVGTPASSEAVAACAAKGVDIDAHNSQPLSRQLIEESDCIFAMERIHQARIAAYCPEAANKCLLLAGQDEIADPIGQRPAVYSRCAELIEDAAKKRISELVI